jgi:hypothetical protein
LNFDRATASKRKGLERDLEKNEEDPKQLHFFRSGAKKREGHQKLASARERVAFEKFQRQQNSEAAARAAAGSAFSNPSTYPAVRGGRLDGPMDSLNMATSESHARGSSTSSAKGCSKSDQTTQNHSTMLRAMANSQI